MSDSAATSEKALSSDAQAILSAALKLPRPEQIQITARLLQSVEDEEDGFTSEQQAELLRRIDEVDRGIVQLIPFDEAMRHIRERRRI